MIRSTERRVVLALLVTALLPLCTAMALANSVVTRVARAALDPELGHQVDRVAQASAALAEALKQALRGEATGLAASARLRAALGAADPQVLDRELGRLLDEHRALASLGLLGGDGRALARAERSPPLDEQVEQPFTVHRAVDDRHQLVAVFAADKRPFTELEAVRRSFDERRAGQASAGQALLDRRYVGSFAVILLLTLTLAVLVGVVVARPVVSRIARLVEATRPVAEGDLSVRVAEEGPGEFAALARAFNAMLEQLGRSRARIEFLKRIGEWQTMARRLAHEIKNPLTPIQLAVEECHQRYRGEDASYRTLLDTTLDIVREEVQSLRRLVGEFAAFARLPRARLRPDDLGEFLREQLPRLERELPEGGARPVRLELALGDEPLSVALDRTMLYRVLVNLVVNGAQATAERAGAGGEGLVRVTARRLGDDCTIDVEDDGPGIPTVLRPAVFDPYVTTKKDGNGLGLTIVKKVVLDHGGQVDADDSPLGGACFRVRLPLAGTEASDAALSQSLAAVLKGSSASLSSRPG